MNDEPAQEPREHLSRPPSGEKPLLGLARVLALIGGLSAAVVGVLIASLSTLAFLFQGQETLVGAVTSAFSIVIVSVGLGLAVAWQALQAMQGRPSRPFRPPRAGLLVVLFLLAVTAGQLILSLDLLPAASFPPFHVLAATLPPLFVLAVAGRALAGTSCWRDIVLQLGSGALISVPLAFLVEAILLVALVVLAVFSVALRPGGEELLDHLSQLLQTASLLDDPEPMMSVLLSPAIIAGVTAVVAGAVPLIEEAVKALGVPLLAYRRPGMSQALLWGLAGGAGFALVEGLLNTMGGLQAWAPVVLVRVGATLLHCLTGALMGLAWYQGLRRRRWWRALGLYGGSVAIHSFWNVLSVGITFLSVGATAPDASVTTMLLSGVSLGLMVALVGTALVLSLGLVGLVRYVRRRDLPAVAAAEDPPALSPEGAWWESDPEPEPGLEPLPEA